MVFDPVWRLLAEGTFTTEAVLTDGECTTISGLNGLEALRHHPRKRWCGMYGAEESPAGAVQSHRRVFDRDTKYGVCETPTLTSFQNGTRKERTGVSGRTSPTMRLL